MSNNLFSTITASVLCIFSCIGLFAAETASVLPDNIYRARLVLLETNQILDKYDGGSELNGLAKSLNMSLNGSGFAKLNKDLAPLVQALNAMKSGMGDHLLNSEIYSEASMTVRTQLAALEYGMNEKLTFGIRVPVVNTRVASSFDVSSVNNAKAISDQVGKSISKPVQDGLASVESLGNNFNKAYFEKAMFTGRGYKAPSNINKTELGDIEIGAKYKFYTSKKRDMSAQLGLRLPTGSVQPIDDLFYQGTGGGTYALGALFFHDYHFNSRWTTGAMIKSIYNFPDTRLRAVPLNENDPLPSLVENDQVQGTKKEHGLDFESEVSLTYNFPGDTYSVWGAYQYVNSAADSYSGPESDRLYYEGLGKGSDFRKSDIEVGASYSTIPAFRRKAFKVPMKIEGLYKTTLEGVNVAKVSYVRMDMIVFF